MFKNKLPRLLKVQSILEKALKAQPLTFRGFAGLFLGYGVLQLFGLEENDLIASIIGGGVIAAVSFCTLFTSIARLHLGRKLTCDLYFPDSGALSSTAVNSGITLSNCSVPLTLFLTVERQFLQLGIISSPIHRLRGTAAPGAKRHLIDSVIFPHRGLWTCNGIRCVIGDVLGLTSLTWFVSRPTHVEVSALTIPIKPLPIIASSATSGEEIQFSKERSGGLYDMKAYDPSDGIKRILWKVYARSGELFVRRPEPAAIPQGEIAIYLIARKKDDYVAGALQCYLDFLLDQNITVLFGTDGLINRATDSKMIDNSDDKQLLKEETVCVGHDKIKHAINCSVWSVDSGTGNDFELFLNSLSENYRHLNSVVVFSARENINASLPMLKSIADRFMVQLSLVMVPDTLINYNARSPKTKKSLPLTISEKFFSPETLSMFRKRRKQSIAFSDAGKLLQSGADVYVVEGSELTT